jgi:hypothetical protein
MSNLSCVRWTRDTDRLRKKIKISDLIIALDCLVTAQQLSTFLHMHLAIFLIWVEGKRFGGVSCTHVNLYDLWKFGRLMCSMSIVLRLRNWCLHNYSDNWPNLTQLFFWREEGWGRSDFLALWEGVYKELTLPLHTTRRQLLSAHTRLPPSLLY